MSNGITSMTDLGLTAKTAEIDAAANASNTDGGGCGGGCNCTCGANDSAETEATAEAGVQAPATTTTAEYLVTGMTCNHCVMSVSEEIFDLEGVLNVSVDLNNGGDSKVTVDSSAPLDPEAVRAAIVVAGYELAAR